MTTTDGRLDVEINNHRSGQLIEATVRGPWTPQQLEDRFVGLVTLRQPAELLVRVDLAQGRDAVLPDLAGVRAALADVGGVLRIEAYDAD